MRGIRQSLDLFTAEPVRAPSVDLHPAQSKSQLWIAVYLPGLALECLTRVASSNPVVVVDDSKQREVVACNERAYRAGIGIGMQLGSAMTLAAELEVLARQVHLERASLELLAAWVGKFTSCVSIEQPASVLFEVSRSLKLFGGLDSIKTLLCEELTQRYHEYRLCVAPTPTAASWLARVGGADVLSWHELAGRLGVLPLAVTCWPPAVQALLRDLGVRTVGECVRLPRDGFARRVGRVYLQELDRALGRQFDLRPDFAPPQCWSARVDLFEESVDSSVLFAAFEELIESLVDELRRRQSQIASLCVAYEHFHHPPTFDTFELLEPTHEGERLRRLVGDRLARRSLPVPVIALRASSGVFMPMRLREPGLFEHKPLEELARALVERLQARFGVAAVHGLCAVAEHRPERAWRKLEGSRVEQIPGASRSVTASPRPLWLLPEPMLLSSAIELCAGPERIESGWWDGRDIARDYYAAKSPSGRRLWVFRDRRSSSWYLHGLFG